MIRVVYLVACIFVFCLGFLLCGLLVDKKITFIQSINAKKEVIWKVWTEMDMWPKWDPDIKYASIEGDFVVGAQGHIILNDDSRVNYYISHIEKNRVWHATTGNKLWQIVFVQERYGEKPYTILHEIRYTGLLGIFPYLKTKQWMSENLPEGLRLLKNILEDYEEK